MPYKNPRKQSEAQLKWYHKNKEKLLKKQRDQRGELRRQIRELKATLRCSRCPENHPATLDFHHRDPSQKDLIIAEAVMAKWSFEKVLEEVAKCEILCSNCHRKEHYIPG